MNNSNSKKSNKLFWVEGAMLVAVTVVLQLLAGLIKIGPVTFSFVLIPLVIASVVHGIKGGVLVGSAFGVIVLIESMTGMDSTGATLLSTSPIKTIVLIIVRCVLVGLFVSLINKWLKNTKLKPLVRVFITSISAPIINTGLFMLFYSTLFYDVLVSDAKGAGQSAIYFLFFGFISLNFFIELLTNLVLCPPIVLAVEEFRRRARL